MAPKRKREDELELELGEEKRDWRNLPKDILLEIHQRLNDKTVNKFELRRIRSVCSSWRSSLLPLSSSSSSSSSSTTLPLKLPTPTFLNSEVYQPFVTASLSQSDLFLFPCPNLKESSWIVKVEQQIESSKWHLQNPFQLTKPASFEHFQLFRGLFDIFDSNVKEITRSYYLEYGRSDDDENPIKAKAVINSWNQNQKDGDDFTVLVLFHISELGLWKPGEADWSIIPADPFTELLIYDHFSDIITFQGKFYAITGEARLIMINPINYEVTYLIKQGLDLGYTQPISYLVESNGRLYLVHKDAFNLSDEPMPPKGVAVYMLGGGIINNNNNNQTLKWKWEIVKSIEDRVFFVSDYVTYSITKEGLGLSKGNYVVLPYDCNCIQPHRFFSVYDDDDDENMEIDAKLEMEDWPLAQYFADCLSFYGLQDSKLVSGRNEVGEFTKIFWPPPDWFLQLHFKYRPTLELNLCLSLALSGSISEESGIRPDQQLEKSDQII